MFKHLQVFIQHHSSRATGLAFGLNSLALGAWAVLIPFAKTIHGLSEGQLGLVLLCLPVGILVANPVSGWLMHRLGVRRTLLISAGLFLLSMATLPWLPNVWLLSAVLWIAGLWAAPLGISMNTMASLIENQDGIRIMSTCHGIFSLGGLVGSLLFQLGLGLGAHVAVTYLSIILLGLISLPWMASRLGRHYQPKAEPGQRVFRLPNRALLLMVAVGIPIFLAEGSAFDWSAVYMREYTSAPSDWAGLAFIGFSLAMTSGRFSGDALLPMFSGKQVVLRGGLTVAAGMLLVALLPQPLWVVLGFTMLGMGASLVAPVLFGAAARAPGYAPGAGLALFSTFAFTAFIAGPPLVGFLAEGFGLHVALGLLGVLAGMGAILSRWLQI